MCWLDRNIKRMRQAVSRIKSHIVSSSSLLWSLPSKPSMLITHRAARELTVPSVPAPAITIVDSRFLRFPVYSHMTHSVYLQYMTQIKEKQQAKDSGEWEALEPQQRQEQEAMFRQLGESHTHTPTHTHPHTHTHRSRKPCSAS